MIKRPLLFGVLAFVIGELIGIHTFMAMGIGMVVVAFLVIGTIYKRKQQQTMSFLFVIFGICLLLGICNGSRCNLQDTFVEYLEMQEKETFDCVLTGRIERIEESDQQRIIIVKARLIEGNGVNSRNIYRVRIYENLNTVDYNQIGELCEEITINRGDTELRIGNTVCCRGELQLLQEATNPGGFDGKAYYRARGIDFLMYADEIQVTDDGYNVFLQGVIWLRKKACKILDTYLKEVNAGIMKAMLLGNSGTLDSQTRKLYQRNGIAHVLAISGLHISILGSYLYKLLRKIGLSYWGAGIPVVLVLLIYGWLTGWSGSTIRAVIMFILLLTGDMIGRTYDMLTALGISCLVILLGNPWRLFDAGFQLSFGAVLSFGIVVPAVQELVKEWEKGRIRKYLLRSFVSGTVLQAVTAPIVVYYYYEYPMYGVLLNMVVVPCMTLVVLFGFLGMIAGTFFPWLAWILLRPCEWLLNFFYLACDWIEELPGAIWQIGAITLGELILYYLVIVVFYLCIKHRKYIGSMLLILFYVILLLFVEPKKLVITMLDVGQGDCILMQTPDKHHVLFDGGSSSQTGIGEYIITPAVKYYGSGDLDYVFVSHMDEDHVNGIEELIQLSAQRGIRIENLVVPELAVYDTEFQDLLMQAEQAGIPIRIMGSGDRLSLGEVTITCIYPDSKHISQWVPGEYKNYSANNTSLVLWVDYGEFDMMLTGDMEEAGEEEIIRQYSTEWLQECDVLKVGHHGSKFSSSVAFLEELTPWFSIISCDKDNYYGHPHKDVLERLRNIGSHVAITPECGAITVEVGKTVRVYGFKWENEIGSNE